MSGIRRTRMHRSVALCIMDFEGGHGKTPFVRPVPPRFSPVELSANVFGQSYENSFSRCFRQHDASRVGGRPRRGEHHGQHAERRPVFDREGVRRRRNIVRLTSSDWDGERFTAERELTDREVGLIASGLGYWGTVFQDALKNTAPAVVEFVPYSNHSGNQRGGVLPTRGNGRKHLAFCGASSERIFVFRKRRERGHPVGVAVGPRGRLVRRVFAHARSKRRRAASRQFFDSRAHPCTRRDGPSVVGGDDF